MQQRRHFRQTEPLDLTDEAFRLRKEARGTPPGIERERLMRKAGQAETGFKIHAWLTSPGLHAPE